uniref:Uncharacterized protein n=1 Tax=Anguilla anguilla TaxID=7936 RepID=A0A0E9STL2_ANGAN
MILCVVMFMEPTSTILTPRFVTWTLVSTFLPPLAR